MTLVTGNQSAYDRVTSALEAATGHHAPEGRDWRCPAHDDLTSSLSVSRGTDRVLLHCHAGCRLDDVLAALSLAPADLFDAPQARESGRPTVRESYTYVDEAGEGLFEVVRMEPKGFRQRRPDGKGGWEWRLGDTRRVLYRLPQVLEAVEHGRTVFVVEGEKDVHALERAGEVATCNPGGAGKWKPEYAEALRGAAEVVVVADQDGPGLKHAADIEASLVGKVGRLMIATPAVGKDAADHLGAGYAVDAFSAMEVRQDDGGGGAGEGGLPDQDAVDLAARVRTEKIARRARRIVHDEEELALADFDAIDVVNGASFLSRTYPDRVAVLGDLLAEGHNATVVARFKVGKSTFAENIVAAATTGGRFLGRYDVTRPIRVALLNYELDEQDEQDRLRQLGLDRPAMERLLVINLRGRRLPLMTDVGMERVARWLSDRGTEMVLVDPFGAAFAAAGGEDENANAQVRRFCMSLDIVKRLAGCRTLVMPHHTGRTEQREGDEHGRGATVLDDWPDVRMLLTRDAQGSRFLRTEGRGAVSLDESRLRFDPLTRGLWLPDEGLGVNRKRARAEAQAGSIADVVRQSPGMNKTQLEKAIHGLAGATNNDEKRAAIASALSDGAVHYHPGPNRSQLHFPGAESDCAECSESTDPTRLELADR